VPNNKNSCAVNARETNMLLMKYLISMSKLFHFFRWGASR